MCNFGKSPLDKCSDFMKKPSDCPAPCNGSRAFKYVKQPADRYDIGENACTEAQNGIQPDIIPQKLGELADSHRRENKKRNITNEDRDPEFQDKAYYADSLIHQTEDQTHGKGDHKTIGN